MDQSYAMLSRLQFCIRAYSSMTSSTLVNISPWRLRVPLYGTQTSSNPWMCSRDFPTTPGSEKLRNPTSGTPYITMNALKGSEYLDISSYVIMPPLLSPEAKTLEVSTHRLAKTHSKIFCTNRTSLWHDVNAQSWHWPSFWNAWIVFLFHSKTGAGKIT